MLEDIVQAIRTIIQVEEDKRASYTGITTTVYDTAVTRYRPMAQADVDLIARGVKRIDWTRGGPHLFLPRTTKGKAMIPISGLCLDLRNAATPELRLHVAFFAANDLVEPPADASELHGVGYRFETPEGGGVGMHGFYHAQPFTHFVKNEEDTHVANCPKWMPVQQPAFPLNAGDPVGLLALMLVSIYGPKRVGAEFGEQLVARIPKAASPTTRAEQRTRTARKKPKLSESRRRRGRGRRDR